MARGSRMAHWWPSTSRSVTASSLGSTPALKRKWLALSTSSCARTTFSAFWIRVPTRPIQPPDSHSTHKEIIHGETDCLQRAFPSSDPARRQPTCRRGEGDPGPQGTQRRSGEEIWRTDHHQRWCDGGERDRVEGPAREHGRPDGARSGAENLRRGL